MTLVIIDNQRVASMLANREFRKVFPFLGQTQAQAVTAQKKKCGRCGRKRQAASVNYAQLRRQIGQMPVDMKAKLKTMLGATQVQVDYTNGSNKTIRLRF